MSSSNENVYHLQHEMQVRVRAHVTAFNSNSQQPSYKFFALKFVVNDA